MDNYDDILKIINGDLSMKDRKKIIDFFKKMYNDKKIVDKLVHLNNQYLYLKIIHVIEFDIDVSNIENKRRDYIKKIIDNKEDNLTKKQLLEYIIYYLIGDNYYNFLINFNQILLYMKNINKILLPVDHIEFYKKCCKLNDLTKEEMIVFFDKYKNETNIYENFYDDMRIVKNHSYNDLVNNSLNIKENNMFYNKELSSKNGVNVYYLNGDNFYAFVRCVIYDKNELDYDVLYCNKARKYYSFSYIGRGNINTIGKNSDNVITLMYSQINPNNIVHIHHVDSSSGLSSSNDIFVSEKINEIYSAHSLISNTKYYNEIVIKKEKDGIVPDAIVCFDKIKDKDLIISHKFNLPIVLVNREKYYFDDGYPDYNNDDIYSL